MELISDPSLPVKLRAAACSLTRQLYVASSARRLRSAKESVWDWDALHKGKLHAACLSLPPRVVRPASEGAKASWAAGRRRASCAGPWAAPTQSGAAGATPGSTDSKGMGGAGGTKPTGSAQRSARYAIGSGRPSRMEFPENEDEDEEDEDEDEDERGKEQGGAKTGSVDAEQIASLQVRHIVPPSHSPSSVPFCPRASY